MRAAKVVEELRARHHGQIVIDAVVPDYYARLPKPCVGGWGRRSLNVTPAGKVLPCHAAESIPGLEFWNVRDRSLAEIWANSPAFNAFRGTVLDAAAVCDLPETGRRFRRLPLPGIRADRRRPRDRSGLPPFAEPCTRRRACGRSDRCALRLPAYVGAGRDFRTRQFAVALGWPVLETAVQGSWPPGIDQFPACRGDWLPKQGGIHDEPSHDPGAARCLPARSGC